MGEPTWQDVLRDRLQRVQRAEANVDEERARLGTATARAMRVHNLSYRDIAEAVGVSHVTVMRWIERGSRDG